MNDKEFIYKMTKDAVDVACDFIAGFIIVMILMLPMIFLK